MEPNDNEYILNHASRSFLRQPSVSEQEHNHQLLLNQQNQRGRTSNRSVAGVKRNAGGVESGGSVTPTMTPTMPSSAPSISSDSTAQPLQLVPLKKVKYHERKKSQNQDRVASGSGRNAKGGASFDSNGGSETISPSAIRKDKALNQPNSQSTSSIAAASQKRRKPSGDSETRTDNANARSANPLRLPGEHEGTRRRIKITTNIPSASASVTIKQEVSSDDGASAADNASNFSIPRSPSSVPSPSVDTPCSSPPSPAPPSSPFNTSVFSLTHSSTSSLPSEIPPETLARFEDAKWLDLSADLFDNSSQTYRIVSSLLYEYASHWARQSPIDCKGGGGGGGGGGEDNSKNDEVNQFFAGRFDAWFEELDPDGGNRQVKSFLRTMAMKTYGSVRNKIIKKIAEGKRGHAA